MIIKRKAISVVNIALISLNAFFVNVQLRHITPGVHYPVLYAALHKADSCASLENMLAVLPIMTMIVNVLWSD